MERRRMNNKYNTQLSPERAKVWKEKSPKYHYSSDKISKSSSNQVEAEAEAVLAVVEVEAESEVEQRPRKVAVVYYLCRNRQLEHPHFIEVPLSSPNGLYLRDVIERLNVLRGRCMASMYSWSCKRSYKNGFVWHDLCEDDLVLPAHGNEYVLKGSELFEDPNSSGRFSPAGNVGLQTPKALPEPPSSRSQDDSSSSSSMNGRATKLSQDDELSPPALRSGSSTVSPESSVGKNSSWNGSLSLTEYKIYKNDGLADASTQTEENMSRGNGTRETCIRGVSTDDGLLEAESSESLENQLPSETGTSQIPRETVSPPPCSSSTSSGGRTDTLENLIKADASKFNSFRILEEEEVKAQSSTKLKASNVLMQLISCGSISVKDHSFGLIPTYKPGFLHSKFPSALVSRSLMLAELDCLPENPRLMGLKVEDKEYFSGSLVETSMLRQEGMPSLKRSSSYSADRTTKHLDLVEDKEETSFARSKCIPRSIKASLTKQPRSESMRSPLSDGPRISSDRMDSSRNIASSMSSGGSKRITELSSSKTTPSRKSDSFRIEEEKVFKIEERLASGARVIIQSNAANDSD